MNCSSVIKPRYPFLHNNHFLWMNHFLRSNIFHLFCFNNFIYQYCICIISTSSPHPIQFLLSPSLSSNGLLFLTIILTYAFLYVCKFINTQFWDNLVLVIDVYSCPLIRGLFLDNTDSPSLSSYWFACSSSYREWSLVRSLPTKLACQLMLSLCRN